MKNIFHLVVGIVSLCAVIFAGGCGNTPSSATSDEYETIYTPHYAEGFSISRVGENNSIIAIKNPWQGAKNVSMEIFVSHDGTPAPEGFTGTAVSSPLRRVICMSSSYTAFIEALGDADAVKGVSGARYMTSDTIRARYSRGEIKDVGVDSNLNYELLASLKPDLVMIYGVAGESSVMTDKMHELGIPVAYIGDYLENSPLGKAEWIVAMGELFGKREYAQELFKTISDTYANAVKIASAATTKPSVMLNAPWRDTWFVPGDRSYMVRLINDAGGAYVCGGVDSEQSRAISGEAAFIAAGKADIWLNPNQAASLGELKANNPKFAAIPSIVSGQVYNNTLRSGPDGGSDFWESGTVRPDIILLDLIKILHPELLPDHELYYYKQLK